jgi:ribosomal-protein-serine acetyltransferase
MTEVTIVPYPTDLQVGGVRLRAYRDADADPLRVAIQESVQTVGRWQDWCTATFSTDQATDWIAHCKRAWLLGDHFELVIVSTDTDAILGGIGVNQVNPEHNIANLGYWVRQSQQDRGIATRAARLATRFGFAMLGLSRIEIVAALENLPSRRIAEKTGARLEGTARKRLRLKGEHLDAAVYGLVFEDLV